MADDREARRPPRTVVVVPTYDERESVAGTVQELLHLTLQPDVLVVDDNSPDGTADVVRTLMAACDGRLDVLVRGHKEGLGRAYVDAFRRVLASGTYDVVVQMDADGSHHPSDVERLVSALEHADLAIGSRYVPDGGIEGWTWGRRLLSRGGNAYAALVLGAMVRDLTGGFKAWRTSVLADLDFETIASGGYAFQIETTMRAVARGARVVEVPIVFSDRLAGHSKMSTRIAVEALAEVPRMRRTARRPESPPRGSRAGADA